eukprot:30935-Pelagococcus_subviridis.AAC.20
MSVATVLAARFENASWPSCSRRLSVSCPSKILAASATAASRSFGPTIWSPVPTPPTTLPPTVPPPTTAAAFAPARPLPLVMTKFSVQFDALPCTSARMSAPTRETSSVGSKPCSGTKTARFGCSLDRRTCVATRLMSPLSKLIAPLGRISTGSAAPFTSTSPPTPKFKTKGYTALSSGPTMSRKPRKRSGSCSSALASLSAVLPPFAGVPGGDARCKKPARLLRASLPKNPPVLVEPGRLAALTPPLGAAFAADLGLEKRPLDDEIRVQATAVHRARADFDPGRLRADASLHVRARDQPFPRLPARAASRLQHRDRAADLDRSSRTALRVEVVRVQRVPLNPHVRADRIQRPLQKRGDDFRARDDRGAVVHRVRERPSDRERDVRAAGLPLHGPGAPEARGGQRAHEVHPAVLHGPVDRDAAVLRVRQRQDAAQAQMTGGDRRVPLAARRRVRLRVEPRGARGRHLRGRVRVAELHAPDAPFAEVRAHAAGRRRRRPADVAGDEQRSRDGRQRRRRRRRRTRGRARRGGYVMNDRREPLRGEVDDRERGVLRLPEQVPVQFHDSAVGFELEPAQVQTLHGVDVPLRLHGLHLVLSPLPLVPFDVKVDRGDVRRRAP